MKKKNHTYKTKQQILIIMRSNTFRRVADVLVECLKEMTQRKWNAVVKTVYFVCLFYLCLRLPLCYLINSIYAAISHIKYLQRFTDTVVLVMRVLATFKGRGERPSVHYYWHVFMSIQDDCWNIKQENYTNRPIRNENYVFDDPF